MTRVKVFIDYQNVYHRARGAFGEPDYPPTFGHVRPVRLGLLVTHLGEAIDPDRKLTEVVVFRGEPITRSHALVQAQFQRQTAAWAQLAPTLRLVKRPLRYNPTAWDHNRNPIAWDKGEEKGIDVLLALEMVLGAVNDDYDVAVVVSSDTDLIPAIDATFALNKSVENAVWQPDDGPARPLRATGRTLWCHKLRGEHFDMLRDDTDWAMVGGDPTQL